MDKNHKNLNYYLPLIITVLLTILLLIIPTGFEDAIIEKNTERVKATVIETRENFIIDSGITRSGEQICKVVVLQGIFKGRELEAVNMLKGSLESDKIFNIGDKALIVISYAGENINAVTMVDHYRINKEIILALLFVIFLILFAGETGVRAIFSFLFTILAIWKILIPLYLKGFNPIIVGMIVTILLTVLIISLVFGFNKQSLSAVLGSVMGIITTCILGVIATKELNIHGAIMSGSESLLYSGYEHLNLTQIFMASIFIGSSGAMMDLAVDITSSMYEIIQKKPTISRLEALKSGLNIGRNAMGTMTTTLLLAYSGGFIALIMVFMAQGTPLLNIFNYKYISAEIIHTIVGSFGLVLVAPFTAFTSSFLLTKQNENP